MIPPIQSNSKWDVGALPRLENRETWGTRFGEDTSSVVPYAPKYAGALAPEGLVALFTKYEAAQLVPQLLDLLRVAGGAETFCQPEECFLFLLLGFDSQLDEFHKHAIGAEIALPGKDLDLSRDLGRQGYASPDMLCAG